MKFVQSNGLSYYKFEIFPNDKVIHGVFTRNGGVSKDNFSSLNVGETTGDSHENVVENRKRIFNVLGRESSSIFDVWQVHSNDVVYADTPRERGGNHIKADAILTKSNQVSLFMQFADCVPIMVYDPEKSVIGIAHAGWQGTVKRIVQKTIDYMMDKLDCDPKNILAGIGPSIGPDHYEVGKNVLELVDQELHDFSSSIVEERNGKYFFNLWEANKLQLIQSGVTQIEVAKKCTACNLNHWYSYRMEGQRSGRFGVLLGLK
jgi:hypothetical protein